MAETTFLTFLIKPGELTLKGGNREGFERVLRRNLVTMLRARAPGSRLECRSGRLYVHCPEEKAGGVEAVLARLMGISGWARVRGCGKTPGELLAACVEEGMALRDGGAASFKIKARRTDKSFPLSSAGICAAAGEAVRTRTGLAVRMKNPGAVISVEIRERAYVYGTESRGRRGLPVGSAGRGLLLLSGGIDSPVAGILMAGRGMGLDAAYFHTPPYTSAEALEKTARLAEIIGSYALGVRLYAVNFTGVQRRIRDRAPPEWSTVLLRMAMMEAASLIARRTGARCLITGESLAQVASQTLENLRCTESRAALPVFRPLIGLDKEAITLLARDFGTYDTSILPHPDCCVLFSPVHPVLRGNPEEAAALYEALELGKGEAPEPGAEDRIAGAEGRIAGAEPGGPGSDASGNDPGLIAGAVRAAELRKCGYYSSGAGNSGKPENSGETGTIPAGRSNQSGPGRTVP
ncbi:MAG: tRNA 4-thiouridine(8) synthase ThiI [Treponema sp.]|jgi:thiamine biosynthesis protein ThiI|nr:tRNA 4-thiouridine(8) synthase ThiI [Treponema sp.]